MGSNSIDAVCPCCETKLKIDLKTGEVIWQKEKPKPEISLTELLRDFDTAREEVVIKRKIDPVAREALMRERVLPVVRFAGTGASNAEKIIYVVDASGSLRSTWPSLIAELTRSIEKLAPTQRFQVIFFQDGTDEGYTWAPHPADPDKTYRLIRATRENTAFVERWFATLSPNGRGDPLEAIRRAFWLEPDAVFLLARFTGLVSDPDRDTLLKELNKLNPRTGRDGNRAVVINGIQFLDADPNGVLEAVGAEHGSKGRGLTGANGYKLLTRGEISARRRTP